MLCIMKFHELLKYYRKRRDFSISDLARELGVHANYIGNIEKQYSKPPTRDRCRQIARTLNLSPAESDQLINVAMEERLSQETLEWLSESKQLPASIDPKIMEALKDPVAVKALLITHRNNDEVKKTIKAVLEGIQDLSPKKRKAILALCR